MIDNMTTTFFIKRIWLAILLFILSSLSANAQTNFECSDNDGHQHYKVLLGRMEYIVPFIHRNRNMICHGPCKCGNDYSKYHVFWVPNEIKYDYQTNKDWLEYHLNHKDYIFLLCQENNCNEKLWENCNCILKHEMEIVNKHHQSVCPKPIE